MKKNEKLTFELTEDYIELIKLLKFMGLCDSGGHAKLAVEESLVKVNGEIELRKRRKVRAGMKVEFNGHIILVK